MFAASLLLAAVIAAAPQVTPARASAPQDSAPKASPSNDASPPALVIVHPPALAGAAEEWALHRRAQGWEVTRLEWSRGDAAALRVPLRERCRAALPPAGARALPASDRVAILLLGDVPGEGRPEGVPTFLMEQGDPRLVDRRDPRFATDGPYQDLDDDGLPDVMLGRVPAADDAAARAFLAKIRASESAPPSRSSRRVDVVGGEGRFGPYDALLETLTASLFLDSVPPEFELRVSYAKATSPFCPPPSALTPIVRGQALSGARLFNYLGHGHPEGFDRLHWGDRRQRILDVSSLVSPSAPAASELSPAPGSPPPAPGARSTESASSPPAPGGVALLVCCSVGWYDLPDRPSFAESLLFMPTGPVAILAGSRPTHPYANALVEREGLRELLGNRPALAGQWDLAITRAIAASKREALDLIAAPIAAQQRWPLSLEALRRQHALLYNLLGDPTTRLVHPPASDHEIRVTAAGTIEGLCPGLADGVARVSLVERRRPVRPGIEPAPAGAADLESRAARTWPRANDWTLWSAEAPLVDGHFEIALPSDLPDAAAHAVVEVLDRSTPEPSIRALRSFPRSALVRSAPNGQGLPADRGTGAN